MRFYTWIVPILITVSQTCLAEDIPIIGMDRHHKPFAHFISAGAYKAKLTASLRSSTDSTGPVLDKLTRQNSCGENDWHLTTVVVGLGIGMEIGLGPIVTAEPRAGIRLVFSNSLDPIFPD